MTCYKLSCEHAFGVMVDFVGKRMSFMGFSHGRTPHERRQTMKTYNLKTEYNWRGDVAELFGKTQIWSKENRRL